MSRKTARRKKPDISRVSATLSAIGLATIAPLGGALAQDVGRLFEFTISQALEASDNPDLEEPAEGELKSVTGIDGSFITGTRSRTLTLGFQAELEYGNEGFQLGDTGVDASYLVFSESSEFELFADYIQRNVVNEVDEGDLDLSFRTGTRTTYGYGARVELGRDAPFGFQFTAENREIEFDTSDPDDTDSSILSFSGAVIARLDPVTELRLTGRYEQEDEEDVDNTRTTDTAVGLGFTRELGNASSVSVDLEWQEVRTEAATTDIESGLGGRLAFDRDLSNGSFGASAGRRYTVNGPIDEVRLNRQIDLAASSIFLEGGIAVTEGDTVSPLIGLIYERAVPGNAFEVSLTQDVGINSDDETVLNTRGLAAYTRNINAVSSLRAELALTNAYTIADDGTTRRVSGSLVYSRDLTEDVALSTGYEHVRRFETDGDDAASNTVFVRVSKSFSARP